MSTEVCSSVARTGARWALPPSGSPLVVLARLPWVSSTTDLGRTADSAIRPQGLTHFEYLMGEFGLLGSGAATSVEGPDSLMPVAAPIQSSTPSVFAAKPVVRSQESIVASTSQSLRKRESIEWMEALLRLDAAIEPYSRAIVLLVLLAAAAFTLLLLRVQPAAIPAKASFVPAEPLAKSLPRELNPASVPDTPPPETRPTIVKAPETPLAEGPASLHPSPPRATLEQEILPATTHALAESYDYPSAKLPAQVGGTLPSESTEGKPVEARLRPSVTPIHSYK